MTVLGNHPGVHLSIMLPASFKAASVKSGGRTYERAPLAASSTGIFIDSVRAAPLPGERIYKLKLVAGFEKHCVAEFEQMARTDPTALIQLVKTELSPDAVSVAQAAEALALSTSQSSEVLGFLLGLLTHVRPFVREAAVRALSPFVETTPIAKQAVKNLAATDASPGVRDAASEVLEPW